MGQQLIMLRGLPGRGKSSLAQALGHPYFEADQWFDLRNGGVFDALKLGLAHEWCRSQVVDALERGEPVVIVSNTGVQAWEIEVYRKVAKAAGARFSTVIVEGRHGGESIHDVPMATIARMHRDFDVVL